MLDRPQAGEHSHNKNVPLHKAPTPPIPSLHTCSYLRDQVRSQLRRCGETVLQGQLQQAVRPCRCHEQPPQRLQGDSSVVAPVGQDKGGERRGCGREVK